MTRLFLLVFMIIPLAFYLPQDQPEEVPNVIGLSLDSARTLLSGYDLQIGLIGKEESDRELNTVLRQNPKAGTRVGLDRIVNLVVAIRRIVPQTVEVPNVVGYTLDSAHEILMSYELRLGQVGEEESDQESGIVLRQNPGAGTKVEVGSIVNLIVAIRRMVSQTVEVPNVVGYTLDSAHEILMRYELRVGQVGEEESDQEPGIVLRQNPEAGTKVEVGSIVNLIVAIRGIAPQTVEVPNVVSYTLEPAQEILMSYELRLGHVGEEESDQEPGIVLRQNPEAGTEVEVGSFINLVIAISSPPLPEYRVYLKTNISDPSPNQSVTFEANIFPGVDYVEFRFDYGDGQVRDWAKTSTTQYSYPQRGTYYPYVSVRTNQGIVLQSEPVTINVMTVPIGIIWGAIAIGVIIIAIGIFFLNKKIIKPKRAKKYFAKSMNIRPHKDLGTQELNIDDGQYPTFTIRLRPFIDKGKQWIEII